MDNKDFVTESIGNFGRFQLSRTLLVQCVGVFSAWQTLVVISIFLTISFIPFLPVQQLHATRG